MGCWAIFAFLLKSDVVPRVSLWADMVFGTGSIITSSVAIGISILTLRREEALRKQMIVEAANKFINENSNELLYIPLCLIANAYNNHHKYERNIYNTFNILNKDVQKEVLKQLNYDFDLISGNGWIDKGINRIKTFIKANDLGRDLLYDNAKYFHRAIQYCDMPYDGSVELMHILPDLFGWNYKPRGRKKSAEKISFDSYLISYLEAKENNTSAFKKYKNKRPIDALASVIDFGKVEERILCSWMMEMVASIAITMIAKQTNKTDGEVFKLSSGDARIETFEDRYLDVLMELYNLSVAN